MNLSFTILNPQVSFFSIFHYTFPTFYLVASVRHSPSPMGRPIPYVYSYPMWSHEFEGLFAANYTILLYLRMVIKWYAASDYNLNTICQLPIWFPTGNLFFLRSIRNSSTGNGPFLVTRSLTPPSMSSTTRCTWSFATINYHSTIIARFAPPRRDPPVRGALIVIYAAERFQNIGILASGCNGGSLIPGW